ncbi:DDE-type integrase/transposase/recombinase [Candidatus Woesearchaeota archaeon]|jgi:putative transposase|nr:DDE-type integrase/transposase/recombinase [Candidatus Woesearchaeota archaeon]
MVKNNKNLEIATFRFGIISDFVTGVTLKYGERSHLLKKKSERQYKIPYSSQTSISISTIKKWILMYKQAGHRLEGLMLKDRKDKGVYKSLDPSIQLAIKEIKSEKPDLTGVALIEELHHRRYLKITETLNLSVLYRFLKDSNLKRPSATNIDRRAFEAAAPNEVWQSDVMHGPYVRDGNKKRKTYLIAIIDDHSRLITHAEFHFSEKLIYLKDCLKKAIEKRGLPQKLYIDNGSCYRALNLEQITAILGIGISHTPPYTPQGRGKIERWFRYVRENFLAVYDKHNSIDALNESFNEWVDAYNNRVHSSIKETPLNKYKKNMKCVRPAPPNLIDYFRMIELRRVKKDRTIQVNGSRYEVAVDLIDLKVEARFHHESPDDIEIYFDGKSYGKAVTLNKIVNHRIGRDYKPEAESIVSGELF